jgi:nucleoid DNA-binding protein
MTKKGIQELSIESQLAYNKLIEAKPGETISYSILSDIIGRDIQSYRHCLYTALGMALRENNMVFVAVRGEGIKRLMNDEIPVVIGSDALAKIRNVSRKSAKKIIAADYDALPNELKIKHNTNLSILGAFTQMTRPKAVAEIESAVKLNDLNQITYSRTLDQFKKA